MSDPAQAGAGYPQRSEIERMQARESATRRILDVISTFPDDEKPVFDAILASAEDLCNAQMSALILATPQDPIQRLGAHRNIPATTRELFETGNMPLDGNASYAARSIIEGRVISLPDMRDSDLYRAGSAIVRSNVDNANIRSVIFVPLIKDGAAIGTITLFRAGIRPFEEDEVTLVQTFATQAVIAIGNVRQFREVQVRLDREKASREILEAISQTRDDDQPVFRTILENASRLCRAPLAFLTILDHTTGKVTVPANIGAREDFSNILDGFNEDLSRTNLVAVRPIVDGQIIRQNDIADDPVYTRDRDPRRVQMVEVEGARSVLAVPLMRDGKGLGVIVLYRREVAPFSDDDVSLVETFAAQAVIAIENTRQFREVQSANAKLEFRLDREAALRKILQIISHSRDDERAVFDEILTNAAHLCNAPTVGMVLVDDARQSFQLIAQRGARPEFVEAFQKAAPALDPERYAVARAIVDQQIVHVEDLSAPGLYGADDDHRMVSTQLEGIRTALFVPLVWGDQAIGAIGLWRREVRAFSDDEIALVESFAAQAVVAIENTRQFTETHEALEYQMATSEVLEVISRSPNALQPVLDTILAVVDRILAMVDRTMTHKGGYIALLNADTGLYEVRAVRHASPEMVEIVMNAQFAADRTTTTGRVAMSGKTVHIPDIRKDPDYEWGTQASVGNYLSTLGVPLVDKGRTVGVITVAQTYVNAFTDRQIALFETFAAQAVIALNNANLFNEVRQRTAEVTEALEYQTATSEVLGVISRSPNELQPVLDVILEVASRICKPQTAYATLLDPEDGAYHVAATFGMTDEFRNFLQNTAFRPDNHSCTGRAGMLGQTVYIKDTETDPDFAWTDAARQGNFRSALGVPLLKDGMAVGVITLGHENPGAFSAKQIALLETFASQAVIALSNARLFDEVQQRTAEVTEALEYQTATSEVLDVISRSPHDLPPVLDAILKVSSRICRPEYSFFAMRDESDGLYRVAMSHDVSSAFLDFLEANPIAPEDGSCIGRTAKYGQTVYIRDTANDPTYTWKQAAEIGDYLTTLGIPLVREGITVGVIVMAHRQASAFTDKQVRLLETFASQAVMALNNTRLFTELNERTAEVEEALERQTATAEVLEVISNSVEDAKPVFSKILDSCEKLIPCPDLGILTVEADGLVHLGEVRGPFGTQQGKSFDQPLPIEKTVLGAVMHQRKRVYCPNGLEAAGHAEVVRRLSEKTANQAIVISPMVWKNEVVGAITLGRRYENGVPSHFSEREMDLLDSFADQAVIAIQNARLFNDTQNALARQTASADVLRVISESPTDATPVFEEIVQSAVRLIDCDLAVSTQSDGVDTWRTAVATPSGLAAEMSENRLPIDADDNLADHALVTGEIVHLEDVKTATLPPKDKLRAERNGFQSALFVPLMRGGVGLGTLLFIRKKQKAFSGAEIGLAESFAAQAVIAIENVRQFTALVEARDAAETALADLKKAQERLIQSEKMASLGQLTAGIAHEIKNPLNFVNNFAKLSDELLEELAEILEEPIQTLATEEREDAEDLMQTVRENLIKINQHGRRADSIVKNMLLHSRDGPSQRHVASLNAIVEEALNLAYHGARAENSSFNIEMKTALAEDAGKVECYPQDLMRVFLNLVTNGMYAAYKRSSNEAGHEPVIEVTTQRLDDRLEVTVRDNGGGIPEDLREQIFTPFFTTKPAGEGTGLGLSLSYDIMVKQHGGDLRVASEPGAYTVFTATLPLSQPVDAGETS